MGGTNHKKVPGKMKLPPLRPASFPKTGLSGSEEGARLPILRSRVIKEDMRLNPLNRSKQLRSLMTKHHRLVYSFSVSVFWGCLLAYALFDLTARLHAAAPSSLQLLQTVTLEGVDGRFDHFTADVKGQRLFVAALGNNSVEVIDLKGGKRIQALRAVQKPTGVLYLPDSNRLYVSSG